MGEFIAEFFWTFFCYPYLLENVVVQINCVAFHNTKKKQFKRFDCAFKSRTLFFEPKFIRDWRSNSRQIISTTKQLILL